MKPQLKPFSAITSEAIWHSAKHWVLLTPWVPKIIWSPCRTLASVQECAYARKPSLQAYPCTYSRETGEIDAISWPLMPGEVKIEEWRGFLRQWHNWPHEMNACKGYATLDPTEHEGWYLVAVKWTEVQGQSTTVHRKGFRPALRRQINPDGTETPVWVWEAGQ